MRQEQLNGYATLILRLSLGTLFIAHGLLKVVVFTIPGTVGYFESLGVPGFIAYLTIIAEIGGGAALIAGVYTRLVSLALIPVLLGSIIFAHAGAGWVFSNEGGGWEYPAFWSVAMIVQALLGDGPYAFKVKARQAEPELA